MRANYKDKITLMGFYFGMNIHKECLKKSLYFINTRGKWEFNKRMNVELFVENVIKCEGCV